MPRFELFAALALLIGIAVSANAQGRSTNPGWTLPPTAAEEKNPLPKNDAVIAAGRKLFVEKCSRCHGDQGKGDGPEADRNHLEHMNLTDKARAARHPDGVVFYKVWNGRRSPLMPAFSKELSREQAWAIVTYVQTLRGR